jgi:hypothetical protein
VYAVVRTPPYTASSKSGFPLTEVATSGSAVSVVVDELDDELDVDDELELVDVDLVSVDSEVDVSALPAGVVSVVFEGADDSMGTAAGGPVVVLSAASPSSSAGAQTASATTAPTPTANTSLDQRCFMDRSPYHSLSTHECLNADSKLCLSRKLLSTLGIRGIKRHFLYLCPVETLRPLQRSLA